MPRKIVPFDIDNIRDLYMSGMNTKEVASALGVCLTTVYKTLRERGLSFASFRAAPHGGTPPRINLDVDGIIRRYKSGETKKGIAESLGVSQMTVHKRLRESGISPAPTRSESMSIRLSRMTPEERTKLTEKAHESTRGIPKTFEDLCKKALGRERKRSHQSKIEIILMEWLAGIFSGIIPQKAIGPYNVDVAIAPVAVEIFGGNWHAEGRHRARFIKRTSYIIDSGWNMYFVWVNAKAYPLLPDILDDLVPYIKKSSSDPTFRRQYRVVWGTGKLVSAGCYDGNDLAFVPSRVAGLD